MILDIIEILRFDGCPEMKVYLDNNATTPIDPRVRGEMDLAFNLHFGNSASVTHAWGWASEELVTIARERLGTAIGANQQDVIFTSGATESINLALLGLKEHSFKKLLYSAIEHKVVLDCSENLKRAGWDITKLPVDESGIINIERLEASLKLAPAIVSIIGGNNEIGTIQPMKDIGIICKRYGAILHLDLAQCLGKIKIRCAELGADLISLSAHKVYGPKGVGALYVSPNIKHSLKPILFGGGHQDGLRPGTENVPGIVGFGRAAELITAESEQIATYIGKLTERFLNSLRSHLPNIQINGHPKERLPGNLNITIPGCRAAHLVAKLGSSVALSTSSACLSLASSNSHVLAAIGLTADEIAATLRIGIGRFNTEDEIDFAIERIVDVLKNGY